MVGLPATGKTHIAKRICRFFSFFHDIPSQIFNVGDYRRQLCGAQLPAAFYDHSNADALAQRTMACNAALNDTIEYTLAVGLFRFIDGQYGANWGAFAAGALLAAIPVVVVFQFLQRFIVSGLTIGAVKG